MAFLIYAYMKRFLTLLFAVLAFVMPLLAQFTSDGYYRVQNFGTKRYLYIKDNTGSYDMHRDVGDFAAVQLWRTEEMTISDPACLLYVVKKGTEQYDLTAQGTGIYHMVERYVDVHEVTAGALRGTYTVSATAAGITKYLSDNELSSVDRGTLGTGGNSPYRNWNVYPVSASGDTYFGITPNVQTGGKYYYPFYAAFPFRLYSSGMKAYIISKVDRDLAVLSEVKDVVPALTPVLIECSSSSPSGNRLDLTTSSASPLTGNEMKGVLFCNNGRPKSKDAITAYNASTMRVLGVTAAGKLGFVSDSDNLVTYSGTRYLPANQAYLAVSADAPSELTIVTEEEYQKALAERSYTLTYLVDGKVFHTESHKAGEAITPQAAPEKEGHTFSGWSTIPTTMPASDYTVTGTFSPNTYTLTYMLDGAEYKKERVLYGTTITPQAAPVKEGYTFSGWTGLPATMPAHDVTATGTLSLNSYTLTYMVDGAVYATETHPFGERLTPLAAPEKDGHTFGGWSEIPATMPSHDVTVTGIFSVNSYTLTYMVDGEVYATETHTYGEALTPLPAPEKEGYTFSGWENMMRSMPAHDVTVSGKFIINSYTLTYLVDGEVYVTETHTYAEALTPLAAPEKEGYTFSGWSEIPATMPAHDVTVTGTFSINEYTLTFVLNGAGYNNDVYRTYTLKYGATVTAPAPPTKSGYTFQGWADLPQTMPARDVTVTGTFLANVYTLTYMVDGAVYDTQKVSFGESLTPLAEPEREGYTFSGWIDFPATMPARDLTISGFFSINSYTVTYVLVGGSYDNYVYRTSTYQYGAAITAPALVPIQSGYNFEGWEDVPATMPAHDITVIGRYKLAQGIDGVTASGEREVFDLSGRRITSSVLPRGIYIINGKKTMIR